MSAGGQFCLPPADLLPPLIERLGQALSGRYRFERELGRGGMATVYLAQDLRQGRSVAIKVLRSELSSVLGPARFLREIDIASRLAHPHIVPLYESGEEDGILYYVMAYVEGETLRERLKRERQLPFDLAMRIASEVGGALAYAHARDIVHRDIKPENILLQDGHAVLADFGIARAVSLSTNEPRTTSGVIVGTATYMSPEQGAGERAIDARTDIYSLGCVLFEMLAGEPPFTGPNAQTIINRHVSEHVPSVRIVRPDLPEEVETIVRRTLAKQPADRYQSAADLVADVDASARRRPQFVGPATRRVGLGLVLGALLVAGAAWGWSYFRGPLGRGGWLLVADFTSPPGEPGLGDDVRELVTAQLRQSRFIRTMERGQLNERMRQAGIAETTQVSAAIARGLARRSSIRGVLLGAVTGAERDGYSIALYVVSAGEEDANFATAARFSSREDLVQNAQLLARSIREQLGERRRSLEADQPLHDVMTPSFQAFEKYRDALAVIAARLDYTAAKRLLHEAIALDERFAAAWAALGASYLSTRQIDSARIAYAAALSFPDRLSPPELNRLRADVAYSLDYDLEATIALYSRFLDEVPHSRSGRTNRGVYLTALGRHREAIDEFREALDRYPFGREFAQPTVLNLAATLAVVGDTAAARAEARHLTGANAGYMDVLLAVAGSRWSEAEGAATALASGATQPLIRIHAITSRASALAARGKIAAADSLLAAAAAVPSDAARWYERARLLLAVSGGATISRRDVVPGDTSEAARMLRALWAVAAGDSTAARAWLAAVRRSHRIDPRLGHAPTLIDAWIAAHGGRWQMVVDSLRPIARRGELDPTMLDRPDSFHSRWLIATAFERLGRPDSAAAYLELALRPTILPPGHFSLRGIPSGFAHSRLALLYEQQGDRPAAEHHIDALLTAFADADSSLRGLVVEAQEARERLLHAGTGRTATAEQQPRKAAEGRGPETVSKSPPT